MGKNQTRGVELLSRTASSSAQPLHTRLLSVKALAAECADITYGQLRNWVEAADENGLSWAICRPNGNRVLIDPNRFDLWLLVKTGRSQPADPLAIPDVELVSRLVEALQEFVDLTSRAGAKG